MQTRTAASKRSPSLARCDEQIKRRYRCEPARAVPPVTDCKVPIEPPAAAPPSLSM